LVTVGGEKSLPPPHTTALTNREEGIPPNSLPREASRNEREAALYPILSNNRFNLLEVLLKVSEHSDVDKISKAYVDYLTAKDADGSSLLSLLESAIDTEVNSTEDPTTLFRSNSRASKLLSISMKVRGLEYVQNAMGDLIHAICSAQPSVEIDPTKIKPEESKINILNLTNVCSSFLRRIFLSIESCPRFIRQLCAYLQKKTSEKFPENKQITENYSPIGGLLFLRFFCSSVFSPQSYGIIKDTPSPDAMRILILVSKVLQMLANGLSFSNLTSEDYMTAMNPFLEAYLDKLVSFYKQIANLEEPGVAEKEECEKLKYCIPAEVDAWITSDNVRSPRQSQKIESLSMKSEFAFDIIHHFLYKSQRGILEELEAQGKKEVVTQLQSVLRQFACPELPSEERLRQKDSKDQKNIADKSNNLKPKTKAPETTLVSVKQLEDSSLVELKTLLVQLKEQRQKLDEQIAAVEQQILEIAMGNLGADKKGDAVVERATERSKSARQLPRNPLKKTHSSGGMNDLKLEKKKQKEEEKRLREEEDRRQKEEEKRFKEEEKKHKLAEKKDDRSNENEVAAIVELNPWKRKGTNTVAQALGLDPAKFNELLGEKKRPPESTSPRVGFAGDHAVSASPSATPAASSSNSVGPISPITSSPSPVSSAPLAGPTLSTGLSSVGEGTTSTSGDSSPTSPTSHPESALQNDAPIISGASGSNDIPVSQPHPPPETKIRVLGSSSSVGFNQAAFEEREKYLKEVIDRASQPAAGIVKDRKHHFRTYKSSFIGSEFVDWLVESEKLTSRPAAIALAKEMAEHSFIRGLAGDSTSFEDKKTMYRFSIHLKDEVALVSPPTSPSAAPPNPFGGPTVSESLSSSSSSSSTSPLRVSGPIPTVPTVPSEDGKLEIIFSLMRSELEVKTRKGEDGNIYKKCFSTNEAVSWLLGNQHFVVPTKDEALQVLDTLKQKGFIKFLATTKEKKKGLSEVATSPPEETFYAFEKKKSSLKGSKHAKKSK
jgi:hypothetical protein